MQPIIQHSSKNHGTATPTSFLSTSLSELVSLMPNMASQLYVIAPRVSFYFSQHSLQGTSEEAAQDIAAFVAIFFENFPSFKGRSFHMAGESYGVCFIFLNSFINFGAHRKSTVQGRYIPLFASAVYDQNAWLSSRGLTPINLTSVMIGSYR